MFKKIFNASITSASAASMVLAGSYVASACLGFLRERLLAGRFGVGNELDVYYAAFTIPDFIALILIFGAISAAVIPIFTTYQATSKERAFEYAWAFLHVFLTFLIVVCAILIIFAPYLVSLIAPGFSVAKKADTVLLMRIMFLSPIILGTSNVISGILQVFHKFLVTALAPLMYNLGIILGIIFLVPTFGLVGLAWGVVLGGFLHLLIQLPAFFYAGFHFRNRGHFFPIYHPGVIKTLKLMIPRSLGLGAGQLNTIAITSIASTLTIGSIAVFNLAGNLSSMFVNALSVSISTAIFPILSVAYSKEDKKSFQRTFSRAFLQTLFLTIPTGILIFLLRAQIIRVILGTGKFGWIDTRLTAACLGVFSLSLFAQGLIFIFSKTFYAAHNTKIPAILSVVTVVFNVIMSFFFVWLLKNSPGFFNAITVWLRLEGLTNISVVGLPMALSLTAIVEAMLLLWFLQRKFKLLKLEEISVSLFAIVFSTLAMAVVAWAVRQLLIFHSIVTLQTFLGVFFQLSLSGLAGVLTYILCAFLLKSPELNVMKSLFKR